MTTGRINQVTTVRNGKHVETRSRLKASLLAPQRVLSKGWSSSLKGGRSRLPLRLNKQGRNRKSAFHPVKGVQASLTIADRAPCISISQNSGALLPVHRTRIVAFGEDYQQPAGLKGSRSRGGSPSGYLTDRFSHRQVIHILLSSQAHATKAQSSARKTKRLESPSTVRSPFPSQYIL